ncbi:hypothetical protein F5X68DRAFT_67514 [Plectosphaerella plurivora]|uniref:Uncharacterized protein n=1 Tax=Plectosphaerella plurivora TaxID=936078 RepID=A0A9P9AEP5_9PEZI|nr:hypothetical protein F5X68DRAFT_67514 [Plectosphaerella plurivora]
MSASRIGRTLLRVGNIELVGVHCRVGPTAGSSDIRVSLVVHRVHQDEGGLGGGTVGGAALAVLACGGGGGHGGPLMVRQQVPDGVVTGVSGGGVDTAEPKGESVCGGLVSRRGVGPKGHRLGLLLIIIDTGEDGAGREEGRVGVFGHGGVGGAGHGGSADEGVAVVVDVEGFDTDRGMSVHAEWLDEQERFGMVVVGRRGCSEVKMAAMHEYTTQVPRTRSLGV